ncbi:hypothetical protein GCM10011611_39330 [Aliidongia dinghuensis]|uniref:Uncharacterized protein n=1 Tax=Aliidongia dinghuensis TaxID=1867774 RepID=A0A8J2YW37_9PROT|nr:hypothetical protein [Aliidongia dinghuensis]GGF29413.1 hypothetical protein GCM10011611_39330 [Aliidongia dinghuensis]
MPLSPARLALVAGLGLTLAAPAFADQGTAALKPADQTKPGEGNAAAAAIAAKSPLVQSAYRLVLTQLKQVKNAELRQKTEDALANPKTCIEHRVGVDDAKKQAILDKLKAEGLIDPADETKFPGGLKAGVFPPVIAEAGSCPNLPQPFWAAPGSVFGGHHSEPGGLAIHTSFNLSSDLSLAENYRRIYGTVGKSGLAEVTPVRGKVPAPAAATVLIDDDIIRLAPMWHDWTKTIVFQWTAEGGEFAELNFGGNGKTDNYGADGDSKTGAHHILAVAETMKRGFPPAFVVTQASAHSAPTGGFEYRVVNWLRAAAIVAGIDPVAKGYLTQDKAGRLRLPAVRELGSTDLMNTLPNQPNLLVEYVLHNLSDADYTYTGPAVAQAQVVLTVLAQKYGYDAADIARFNTKFRNPALSYLGAEHVQIVYANKGLDGVAADLDRLRKAGVI